MSITLTIHQVIADAKKLVAWLKESDSTTDTLITKTNSVLQALENMNGYSEDVNQTNDRQKPQTDCDFNIQQESKQLSQLQKENIELRAALEDHQCALELIMSKYRQQITDLMKSSSINYNELLDNKNSLIVNSITNQIAEMGEVMNSAAGADEEEHMKMIELISKLTTENQGLRELLQISKKYQSTGNLFDEKEDL